MADSLNTTVSQQASTITDNPQSVGASTSINGNTKNTQSLANQPSLNNSSNVEGIPLINTQPNVVSLGATTSTVSSVAPAPKPKTHHVNPVAGGIVVLLIIVAVAYAVNINRSAKKTTY